MNYLDKLKRKEALTPLEQCIMFAFNDGSEDLAEAGAMILDGYEKLIFRIEPKLWRVEELFDKWERNPSVNDQAYAQRLGAALAANTMRRVGGFDDLREPGDYFISTDKTRTVINCPACNTTFSCTHKVVSEEPLTLEPSVVGPDVGFEAGSQVRSPCQHHFWIRDGKVVDLS